MATFSVITPSYNQGRYLGDCIRSVAEQGPLVREHLVIDAGSTDETLPVLAAHPQVGWVSEPDRGQADAINKGFRRATGDWVMWLNADDYLLPSALDKVDRFVRDRADVDVVYGDCLFVDAAGKELRRKSEGDFDFDMLVFYGCYIPSTATFIRRAIVEGGQWLDERYRVCMDLEYYLRLARAGARFAHLPEPLACFRWHATNASSVQADRRRQERRELQREQLRLSRRTYLDHDWLLALLFRAYQGRRVLGRAWRRLTAS